MRNGREGQQEAVGRAQGNDTRPEKVFKPRQTTERERERLGGGGGYEKDSIGGLRSL